MLTQQWFNRAEFGQFVLPPTQRFQGLGEVVESRLGGVMRAI
jgi:hypothetical protein